MDKENNEKIKKYNCIFCNFNTSNKTDYTRHILTDKHKKIKDNNEINKNNNYLTQKNEKQFTCFCGKSYKHKPNLYAHKKKCNNEEPNILVENKEDINYKDLVLKVIEQNTSLQNTINELIPKIGNNNSVSNISNINQNLNINFFLNDKCKDAININDFIKTIEVSINDLLFTKDNGLAKGIHNLLIENLNKLPTIQRPIWCSDLKRKKIYIKEDTWSEDINNVKTKTALNDISNLQFKNVNKYTQNFPNWVSNDKHKDNYIAIVKNSTEPIKENQDKVINMLIDSIHLQKHIDI
jgi:hypothetical protein